MKNLIMILCLVLSIDLASAKIIDSTLYEIPRTLVAPVIDGKQDAVWKTLDWNFQNSYRQGTTEPDGWADLFGASKMMWDDDNLYGLFYTQDDSIVDTHINWWERDGFVIYIDADNSKGWEFDANDLTLSFRYEFINDPVSHLEELGFPIGTSLEGIEFAILDDTTTMGGFWLEFKIPLTTLAITPATSTLIGLELQQSDNDSRQREHVSKWWLDICDGHYCDRPRAWGTAILSSRTVDDRLEIKKTPIAPAIDGVMDDLYAYGNPITQNSFGNGPSYPVDFHDNFVRFYALYDDENLYGFYDVYDDTIVDVHANSWERDAVEIYTDADNSKGERYDGVNDQHLVFRHEFIDGGYRCSIFVPCPDVELKVVDDSLGYDMEFRIALSDLGIKPEEGRVIGFEIQQTDNDGTGWDHLSKWWLEHGDDSWLRPNTFGTAYLGPLIVAGLEEKSAPAFNRFSLAQNYPNPFNPSTKISYTLKSSGKIRLSIHDITGREVAVLVDGVQNAGADAAVFSGRGLASGIYFYRLLTADEVITKKMALVR